MAKYLNYEGLKLYDKNIKGVIAIKAVSDVSKVTNQTFPENSVIQYIGQDTNEEKLKVVITEFDSDLNIVFITDANTWNNFESHSASGALFTGVAEDGKTYTLGYSGSGYNVIYLGETISKSGHAEAVTEPVIIKVLEHGKFYKVSYNGDTPSFKYVELGADPEAVALAEDVESNVTAGAINPGDIIKEGTNFTAFVKKLLTKEIPLTATLQLTQEASTFQIGDTVSLTNVTAIIKKGSASTIEKAVLFIGDSTDEIELEKRRDDYGVTLNNEYTKDTSFRAVITYKKSDGETTAIAEAKAAYKFINPILTFKVPGVNNITTELDNIDLASLNTDIFGSELKELSTYKFPVNVNAGVCGIGVPEGTSVSSIKDNSGFEYFDSFIQITKEVTDKSGATVNYTFYVSPKATLTGTFAYTFK